MAITAQEPLDEAKVLLNNPSGSMYPDSKLIPILQKAYRELQTKMMLNGLPVLKETSAAIQVTAGTKQLSDGAGLPTDFVYPIELSERTPNSTELYREMEEMDWEPDIQPIEILRFWNWREEEVKFVGATANREVRVKYMKGLSRIVAGGTVVAVINSVTFLASRTAAIAALIVGSNPSRSQALAADAQIALDELIATLVKREQGHGVRRQVNRYRR